MSFTNLSAFLIYYLIKQEYTVKGITNIGTKILEKFAVSVVRVVQEMFGLP
jgi:hypothetical protein